MGHRRVPRLIVGGGIGGLATALALANAGLDCHVIEQAEEFTEIGAGIQLAPNALRVLDGLRSGGQGGRRSGGDSVLDAVLADAVRPPKAVMMDAVHGEPITTLDFGHEFRETFGYPYVVTHRTDLLDALLAGCRSHDRVTLETSRRVTQVHGDGETAVVTCADGTAYETEALIGADGIWSAVREHTLGDGEPTYIGHVAYRGTIPIEEVSAHAGTGNVTWWVGPGIHLIQYPLRGGTLYNQVAVFEVERTGDPEAWGPPEELERCFGDKTTHVRDGLRLIGRDRRWILRDRPPAERWTKGRATLLGDAAHPMVQYLAQGACMALEDAAVLAECLAGHRDVDQAFAAYERERVPRTGTAQRWARRMGEIVHAGGTTALLRDALLNSREDTDFHYLEWLYGYRATGGAVHA